MAERFRNKYRIGSSRLNGYDYSRNGAYFITICTKNHGCLFGKIIRDLVDTDISDNGIGIAVETGLRPVSTKPGPIEPPDPIEPPGPIEPPDPTNRHNNYKNTIKPNSIIQLSEYGKIVSDCWFDLPNHYSNIFLDEFVIMPDHVHGIILIRNYSGIKQKHGISEFVRAFKSFSSRRINELRKSNHPKIWQPRFHDHIIRSNKELHRIRNYIRNNPGNWINDKNK